MSAHPSLKIVPLALGLMLHGVAHAADTDALVGTWKLVSSTSRIVETGQEVDTYGAHPTGWITYGRDGRMMVLIVAEGRPKPQNLAKVTDAERAALFKTMAAYSGTYTFDGRSVTHSIDASWNETWTGTRVVRDVERQGDRLILKTRPAPASGDGRVSVITLVWEKLR